LEIRRTSLVESTPCDLELSVSEARALADAGRRLATKRITPVAEADEPEDSSVIRCAMNPGGTWRVTVTDAVGVIAVGDLRLLVEPKIPRSHLFHLFGSSALLPRLDDATASAGPGSDLWELVARWLVQALERVIERDLVRDYVARRDTLEAARGTIDALATAESYYQGALTFVCEYEEFGDDTPLNRVLRAAAVTVVASAELPSSVRRRALAVVARMADVGPLLPGDLRVRLDRRTAHCRDALALARNMLENVRRTLTHGEEDVWTFLIRTPELVEAGIRNELRRRFIAEANIRKELIPIGDTMTVAPDLVFGSIDAIGDVKYKLARGRWLRSDLYEAVAFATAARSSHACVIGFRHHGDPYPPVVTFGDTEIRYFCWVCDESVRPELAGDALAEEIAAWLGTSVEAQASGDQRN
jgi:5-methylcytosine-specific restriction enzyme subunit McrC